LTGLACAARLAWLVTMTKANIKAINPASGVIHQSISILMGYLSRYLFSNNQPIGADIMNEIITRRENSFDIKATRMLLWIAISSNHPSELP